MYVILFEISNKITAENVISREHRPWVTIEVCYLAFTTREPYKTGKHTIYIYVERKKEREVNY